MKYRLRLGGSGSVLHSNMQGAGRWLSLLFFLLTCARDNIYNTVVV